MTDIDHVPNYSFIPERNRVAPPAVDIMARTIFGEARGERWEGKIEVAHVIMNRVEHGGWWGDTIIKVCTKPYQFSCWNENDPNRDLLLNVHYQHAAHGTMLRECLVVAMGVRHGLPGFASRFPEKPCHYHATSVSPSWKDPDKSVGAIGGHVFYAGIA